MSLFVVIRFSTAPPTCLAVVHQSLTEREIDGPRVSGC